MLPFFWYMLKVMICSGILFGYYWVFLRNKVFHRYNRFYLLSTLVLSLLLPLLKISFWQPAQAQSQVIKVLQAVSAGDEYMNNIVITAKVNNWTMQDLYPVIYWLVCGIFLVLMLRTLFLIRTLLKKYPVQIVDEIAFVNTNDNSTPFSFLRFIFWNNNIDIDTTTGKQIFKHEVAHIQEKHTYDKLFVNAVLVFGWCNPFFWLYRKELNMIHEFIADQKAVEDSDTADFAAMILQAAYPRHQFELTNNFFYSPIKRRLLMLTKDNNPRVNYFARIMALPLAILIFAAFSLKARTNDGDDIHTTFSLASGLTVKPGTSATALIDSLFETVDVAQSTTDTLPAKNLNSTISNNQKPICILDGKEVDSTILNRLNPNEISTIDVLKDEAAIKKYGDKGKKGVILIKTKKYQETVNAEGAVDPEKALIIYNGVIIGKDGKRLDGQYSQLIAATLSEKRLKKTEAIEKYGADGINGAIEYNTADGISITTAYVDADKIPVSYIGIDNPVTVTAQNVKPEDLLVTISEGKIFGSNGKYIVHVTHEGEVTLSLSKRDGTKLPGSFTIKVKRLPDLSDPAFPPGIKVNMLYDTARLLKQKEELELLTIQQNLAKLDYAEKKVQVNVAGVNKEMAVAGRKLQEKEIQKLKEKYLLIAQTNPNQRYVENVLLSQDKAEAYQKQLAEIKVEGIKLQDVEIQNQKLKLAQERQAKTNQEYEEKQLLLVAQADDYQKQLAELKAQGKPIDLVFTKTEVSPRFPGGEEAWRKYLIKNLKASMPVDEGWKAGKYMIIVKFIVHTDGTVSDVTTENYKGTKTARHCIEIIKNGPKWLPAIQNGKTVNAYKKQPITFVIEEQ
ncbi:MAG: hypothetical protein IPP96_11765 [Chitinophagaceae bacterium]|nr:hypothetical protein [Chitinophagaceae bacterium]